MNLFLKHMSIDPSLDIPSIASKTTGFTGADLKGLVQEVAILSMHDKSFMLKVEHFEKVLHTPGRRRSRKVPE